MSKTEAYSGGSGSPPKKFKPQQEHGSEFFGGGPDPPGYSQTLREIVALTRSKMCQKLSD